MSFMSTGRVSIRRTLFRSHIVATMFPQYWSQAYVEKRAMTRFGPHPSGSVRLCYR